jgi:hypothetical protein
MLAMKMRCEMRDEMRDARWMRRGYLWRDRRHASGALQALSVAERFPQFVSGYWVLHLSHLAFRISHLPYSFNTRLHQEMHLDRTGLPLGSLQAAL